MCQVFSVSRSGYYRWRKYRHAGERRSTRIDGPIREAFESSRCTYGSPRVTQALAEQEIFVSKSTVARRMNKLKIRAKAPKKYIPTTQSKHDEPVAPNLLDRHFKADRPGLKWVSDITYFRVNRQWCYLTVVLDLADRYVVGWSISNQLTAATTTIAAFRRAAINRPPKKGLIFHSDRGVQYASQEFRQLLKHYLCRQSMSRKGNCWDNAVAESFFKTIKSECLSRHRLNTMNEAFSVIFRYLEGWYNTRRIHSSLGGLSPTKMYHRLMQKYPAA
jgi:transposase InsO family protein